MNLDIWRISSRTSSHARTIQSQKPTDIVTVAFLLHADSKHLYELTCRSLSCESNVVGDIGNSLTDTIVDATDERFIAANVVVSRDVTNRFDINRDGQVNELDMTIVQTHQTDATQAPVVLDLRADFDGDGITGPVDTALLTAEIMAFAPDVRFDLTGDARVDQDDLHYLFDRIAAWLPGDANGDRRVDGKGLAIVRSHLYQSPTVRASGDFDGDGATDAEDLNVWLAHRFLVDPSAPAAHSEYRRVPRAAALAANIDAVFAQASGSRGLLADAAAQRGRPWATIERRNADLAEW